MTRDERHMLDEIAALQERCKVLESFVQEASDLLHTVATVVNRDGGLHGTMRPATLLRAKQLSKDTALLFGKTKLPNLPL